MQTKRNDIEDKRYCINIVSNLCSQKVHWLYSQLKDQWVGISQHAGINYNDVRSKINIIFKRIIIVKFA